MNETEIVLTGLLVFVALLIVGLLVWSRLKRDFVEGGYFPKQRWLAHGRILHMSDSTRCDRYVQVKLPNWRWMIKPEVTEFVRYERRQCVLVWVWRHYQPAEGWEFSVRWWTM